MEVWAWLRECRKDGGALRSAELEGPNSVCPGLSCFPGRGPSRGNRENQDEEVTCVELKDKMKK